MTVRDKWRAELNDEDGLDLCCFVDLPFSWFLVSGWPWLSWMRDSLISFYCEVNLI